MQSSQVTEVRYISSKEISQICADYLEKERHEYIDPAGKFKVDKNLGIQLIKSLFGNVDNLASFIQQSGSFGQIAFAPVNIYSQPVVVKLQDYNAADQSNHCAEFSTDGGMTKHSACGRFLHELVANQCASFLYLCGYNPNLLNFYGAFYYEFRNVPCGALILEQADETLEKLFNIINETKYRQLVQKYHRQLSLNTIFLIIFIQVLLSLDQLQATCQLLHADLKPNNVFLRITQSKVRRPSSLIRLVRRHYLDQERFEERTFYIPDIGLQPVIADLGISAFSLDRTTYSLPNKELVDDYGLQERRREEYKMWGIDPYLVPLPVSDFVYPRPRNQSASNSPPSKSPARVEKKDIRSDVADAYNSYDLDFFLNSMIQMFEYKFPQLRELNGVIKLQWTRPGRYTGKLNQTNFPDHACNGAHSMRDDLVCPLKYRESNLLSGVKTVFVSPSYRPDRLSQQSIMNILSSEPFRVFQSYSEDGPLQDPAWQQLLNPDKVYSHYAKLSRKSAN